MKKLIALLLIGTIILSTIGCGSQQASDATANTQESVSATEQPTMEESEKESEEEPAQTIEVDENLFTVDITLPASFFEGATEEITQEYLEESIKEEDGIKSVKLNEDGSVTYTMTKAKQREMLEEFKAEIEAGLEEVIADENSDCVGITHNDDFTEFIIMVEGNEIGFYDAFCVIAYYMYGATYNAFAGNEVDDIVVIYKNAATGDVIDEAHMKDM